MSKHTPGPWIAHSLVVSEQGQPIGRYRDICHCGIGMRAPADVEESVANARLIAAAPELLALLIDSQIFIGGDWRERRDAAIAKATGEPS